MKYLYLNQAEDRVVSICKQQNMDLKANPDLVEYSVPNDFDLTKDIDGVRLEGFLTASEFLSRLQSDYVAQRVAEYPPVEDYLDAVVKGDQAAIDDYIAACQAVKAKYPKG